MVNRAINKTYTETAASACFLRGCGLAVTMGRSVNDVSKPIRSSNLNLGEWMNYSSYAVFDGEKLELKHYPEPVPK
ncbi:MAG: hypothetical protein ACLQQ4_03440 [Bacteroidia bacterium]